MRAMNTKASLLLAGALCAGTIWAGTALAQVGAAAAPSPIDAALTAQLQSLARESASTAWPCARVEPYLPAGVRLAGRTRIGLRCTQGATRWNVYLPLTVRILARSLVASTALPAGTVLRVHHLAEAEVDLAASPDPAIAQTDAALGRTLARPLAAGDALRQGDLKSRSWFAAGDLVHVVAVGPGFSVSAEGQALGPGLEGQPARVRTESGRIVTGMPVGERRIEVPL